MLGPAAAPVRRAVGAIAWIALEYLAATSTKCDGDTVSHESVRRLADALGLAKDTVGRALRRLADAGFIAYVPARSSDGRFGRSHYRLTFPADLFLELPPNQPAVERARPRRTRRDPDPPTAAQLTLIDPSANDS